MIEEKLHIDEQLTDQMEITERKIGGTTYVVTTKYRETGEQLKDKLWRLISNDRGDYNAD